jgi:hypothetical protein
VTITVADDPVQELAALRALALADAKAHNARHWETETYRIGSYDCKIVVRLQPSGKFGKVVYKTHIYANGRLTSENAIRYHLKG